jgi:hypothetical protein
VLPHLVVPAFPLRLNDELVLDHLTEQLTKGRSDPAVGRREVGV